MIDAIFSGSGTRRLLTVLAVIALAACAVLLLPQARDALIAFGGNVIHRPLNAESWRLRLLVTAWAGMAIFAALLFCLYSKRLASPLGADKTGRVYSIVEIALPALFALSVLILAASNKAIWVDEAYSLAPVRHSFGALLAFEKDDVHPPLFFIIEKLVSLVFGDGVFAMKMVSAAPMLAALIITTLFLRKEFSRRAAVLFQLCFLASEAIVHYSIEIRMYALAFFFVTMAALAAWYIISTGKARWWVAFLLCAEGAAYTHYYAAAVAAIGWVMLFIYALKFDRAKIRPALLTAAGAALLYLPWLFTALTSFTRASGDFWIPPITLRAVIGYIQFVFSTGSVFLSLALCLLYFVIFCSFFKTARTKKEWFVFAALCCLFVLAAAGIAVSLATRPLMVDRYLFPAFGLVWLFFAVICGSVKSRRAFVFVCAALLTLGAANITSSLVTERKENRDFTVFHDYLSQRIHNDDLFVFVPDPLGNSHLVNITAYLFPGHTQILRNFSSGGLGNSFQNMFDRTKLPYSALSDKSLTAGRAAWVFAPEEDNEGSPSPFFILRDNALTLCGTFGWGFYKFNLYYTEAPGSLEKIFSPATPSAP